MLKAVFKSIQAYFGAFALISKLKLWKFFAIPIIISIVTAIIIGVSAYGFSDNLGTFISKVWIWEWGKNTFSAIVEVFSGLLILALGLILFKHIIMALSAPFMSAVSEKIELHLLGKKHTHRNTSFQQQLWRGIRINVRNLGMELILTILIFMVGLIPVIGWFTSLLIFVVQAYYAGFGNMDYTLERHLKYNESLSFVRKNRGTAIGNGLGFLAILLIPIIGVILVLPLSVTAASTKTIELLDSNKDIV